MAENIQDIKRPEAANPEPAEQQEAAKEEENTNEEENGKSGKRKPKEPKKKRKKMSGPIFWLVLLIAITADTLTLVCDFSVVFAVLSMIIQPIASFIIFIYYFLTGVATIDKKIGSKVITWGITFILGGALIPTVTINLLLTRMIENSGIVQAATTVASARKGAAKALKETKETAQEAV